MNPGKSDTYVGDPVVGRDDNGGDLAYIAWPVQNKGCGPSTFWVPNTERHAMYSVRQIDTLGQVFRSLVQIRGSQDHGTQISSVLGIDLFVARVVPFDQRGPTDGAQERGHLM